MNQMNVDTLHRIEDIAPCTGLTPKALWNACRAKQFPHVRIGRRIRVPESALQAWIAEQLSQNVQQSATARAATA